MEFSQKKLEKSEFEITVFLTSEELEAFRARALDFLKKSVKKEGFRPGHVPAEIVEKELGEAQVLSEMGRLAVEESYTNLVKEQEIDVIGEPEVQILKIATRNPFEYKIRVAVLPEVALPDYKETASHVERRKITIEEKDVDEALDWLQKSRKVQERSTEEKSDLPAGEAKITDEFAQSLGNFANVAALRESVQEGLQHEKEMQETDRLRQEIIEKVAQEANLDIPEILIEREKAVLLANTKKGMQDVLKMSFEDYVKQSGKSEQELLDSFAQEARLRVKKFLVVREVAKKEGIKPTEEEVKEEANKILQHYKSAKTATKDIDPARLREYTEGVIRHEKTLQFLEGFAKV